MKRRHWALLILVVVAGAAWWGLSDYVSIDTLTQRESALRRLVDEHPISSLWVGFAAYVAVSLVPGTGGKSFIYGWLFGFWTALLIVNVGLTLAAIITFLVIRSAFQESIRKRLSKWVAQIDKAVASDGAFYLVTLRLLHAPYSLMNYASAATRVRTRTFWWTTQTGMLPGNIAFVLAGSQVPTLEQIAREGPMSLVNFPLLISLTIVAVLPLAVRWVFRLRHSGD